MRAMVGLSAMLVVVGGCNAQPTATAPDAEKNIALNMDAMPPEPSAPPTSTNSSEAVAPPAPGTPGGLPDDRTALAEPQGPIDPKSPEAAGQLVQRFGGLLEQGKFAEARRLWGSEGEASGLSEAQFVAAYGKYASISSQVGKPFDGEGAAGSLYIQVPLQLSGTLKSGGAFNLVGPLTLRRVNDVDGATPAQLRWHIVQSDLKPRP